jgi:ATP-dependent RNA helicase DHX37/DHR1
MVFISSQIKVLKQLICAAFIDQVAVRKDLVSHRDSSSGSQYSNSHGVPYRALGITEDVFLHPSSVLWDLPPPSYIVFQEVVRTTRVFVKGTRPFKFI